MTDETKTTKDLSHDDITRAVLTTLLRFGALPAWCLFWHTVEARDYRSISERKTWEEQMRRLEARKLVVRTTAAPDAQYDSGLPSKTKLIRLSKAGAEWLAACGVTDVLGNSPEGLRASDFHTPASWRHDALAAGVLAWLAERGYEFVTDHEIQRVAKSLGTKLPDGLVRKRGCDEAWIMIEVEYSKKTGGWAERQARAMAKALDEEFTIGDRWQVRHAWLVTTTRKESPTPEAMAERISAYVLRPTLLHALLFTVDETGKPLGMVQRPVSVTPCSNPEKLEIRFAEYGERYVEMLLSIEAEDERMRQRGQTPPVRPEQVTVARVAFGPFAIALRLDWPRGSAWVRHRAVLMVKDRPIAVSDLGDAEALTPAIREMVLRITQWGHVDDDQAAAEYVVTELVYAGRPELIRALPELVRWYRADGRHYEQIADDYRSAVRREEEEERQRRTRWRDEQGKAA